MNMEMSPTKFLCRLKLCIQKQILRHRHNIYLYEETWLLMNFTMLDENISNSELYIERVIIQVSSLKSLLLTLMVKKWHNQEKSKTATSTPKGHI